MSDEVSTCILLTLKIVVPSFHTSTSWNQSLRQCWWTLSRLRIVSTALCLYAALHFSGRRRLHAVPFVSLSWEKTGASERDVPLARSSLSITVDEKRKGLHAVHYRREAPIIASPTWLHKLEHQITLRYISHFSMYLTGNMYTSIHNFTIDAWERVLGVDRS